jgi:Ca2+-binding RTX toxin-like protein
LLLREDQTVAKNIIIDNIGTDDTYVIVKNSAYGAIAYHFQRDIGGSSDADSGAPYGVWRRTGEYGLDSVKSDPVTSDRTLIASDVGAFDYAFYSVPNNSWGGSYHGGETLVSYSGPDLSKDATLSQFSRSRDSVINYENGDSINVHFEQSIGRDGSLKETVTATSDDSFSQKVLGMEIGSGTGWTEVSTDKGAHFQNMGSSADFDLGNGARDIVLRNSVTGQEINVHSNAAEQADFLYADVVRLDFRSKLYLRFEGGVMDTISATRTVSFDITPVGHPVHVLSSETYALAKLDTDLRLTGDSAVDGTGNKTGNTIIGNGAVNTLAGAGGDDLLKGGRGGDVIDGGAGADRLYGGGDKDVFVFSRATESAGKLAARDTIFDFSRDDGDQIDLASIDANGKKHGNGTFDLIERHQFTGAHGELRYGHHDGDTVIYGDIDGDKKADLSIVLHGTVNLADVDFLL